MATIKEDYVSFETAKLLKEKGFDGFCERFYDFYPETGAVHICGCDEHNNSIYDDEFSMPTLQMAMKWLREVHNIHIVVNVDISSPSFFIDINKKDYDGWISANDDTSMVYSGETIFTKTFCKYEQAAEEAIKYCLKHLI